jgi:hypothetical protein
MRQIVISIDDEAYEPVMGVMKLCDGVEIVDETEIVDIVADRDVWMRQAIETLRGNKAFRHYYDYTWIMMALNEGLVDDFEAFRSPQAFLDYLYEIGIRNLPSRYSISLAFSKTIDSYPNWTFIDVKSPSESLRRKNVVRQFLSAYGAAKRGKFNKVFNK